MRTLPILAIAIACLLRTQATSAAVAKYKATINGAQEVPPVSTDATGSGDFDFDDVARTLTGTVTLTGLGDVAGGNIHVAPCGQIGATLFSLYAGTNPGVLYFNQTLSDAQATELVTGNFYVHIHTATSPPGPIRGQLLPESSTETCLGGGDAGADAGAADASAPVDAGVADAGASNDGGRSRDGTGASTDAGGCSISPGPLATSAARLACLGFAVLAFARRRKQ